MQDNQTTQAVVSIKPATLLALALEWENDARKLYDCADTAEHVLERAALRGAAERVQRMADKLRIMAKANLPPHINANNPEK
jgi:hypothetical protein